MMRQLTIPYSTWKLVLNANSSWVIYQKQDGQSYHLWSGNLDYLYATTVSEDDLPDYSSWYDDRSITSVTSEDEAIAYIVGVGSIVNQEPRTTDGRLRVAVEKSTSTRTNFYSHDFTDPCTWYQKAIRVVDEIATDSGDQTTYNLDHTRIIDNYHGRITQEDELLGSGGFSLRVSVKVNDVLKTEQDPHYGSGGDYTVNYDLGNIIFLTPLDALDEVKVTYYYATTSVFTVKPESGKSLMVDMAEVQFSSDVNPKDTVMFEAWGIADFFLTPEQMTYFGIPYGISYMIMLQRLSYKTMSDFHNDAFRSYPSYPALGDPNNWRSQIHSVTTFDWDYLSSVPLSSSKGMEIRVHLEHDEPFEGYMSTATFYCRSEDE